MENSIPLSIAIENTRAMVIDAFNQIQKKANLPAYLMEGIVLDLLSDIRNRKNIELVIDLNRTKERQDEKEGDK